jgi:hypothetical protein
VTGRRAVGGLPHFSASLRFGDEKFCISFMLNSLDATARFGWKCVSVPPLRSGLEPVYLRAGEMRGMPLEFRGSASMDPPRRRVRFAGYPISARHPSMVICEVSTEALRLLGEMPDASGEQLMGVFEIYKDTILAIASRKFDKGETCPRITDKDVETRAG